ncbi:MAG: Ig-like domain-containing protein, partial [Candidatus Omnitrophota bacterium]
EQIVDTVSVTINDGKGGTVSGNVEITVNPVEEIKEANLSVGTNSGYAGDTGILIPINLSSEYEEGLVCAINFDILYDQTALKVEGVTAGEAAAAAEKLVTPSYPEPGVLRVIVFGMNQNKMKDGIIVNVNFEILAGAEAGNKDLKLKACSASDPDAKEVTLNTANGEIEILEHPNQPPIADNQTVNTEEDKAVSITLTGSDPDNDKLTYIIVAQASHGSLSGTGSKVNYTPAENYNGSDKFSFKVNDGKEDSNIAEVAIDISPLNDAPVLAKIEDKEVEAETELKFKLEATDVEGDKLEFSIIDAPQGASIDKDTGEFSWKPAYDQARQYQIEFEVEDTGKLSDSQKAKIKVTKEGTPPEGEIYINGGAEYTNKEDVILTLSAVDMGGSGVELMQLSNHGSSFSEYEPYATSKQWKLSEGEGKKQVYVRFKDKAGNESKVYKTEIILDKIEPSGRVEINKGANYTNNPQVKLQLEASDKLSGISKVKIKNESEPAWKEFSYEKEYIWQLTPSDGTKYVYVELEDGAGNKSQEQISASIVLDTTAPAKPVVTDTDPRRKINTVTKDLITLKGTKEKDASIYINGEEKVNLNSSETWTTQYKLKEGENILKITSKDIAGNESAAEELTIRLKTRIRFIIIQPIRRYVGRHHLVGDSLNVMVLYTIDDDKAVRSQKASLKEGSNIITISAQDEFGNEDKYELDLVLDTQGPQIGVDSYLDNETVTTQNISLSGAVQDSASGIAEIKVNGRTAQISGNRFTSNVSLAKGVNTIIIEAKDNADNVSSKTLSLNYLVPEEPPVYVEPVEPVEKSSPTPTTYTPGQTIILTPEYKESVTQSGKDEFSKWKEKNTQQKHYVPEAIADNKYTPPLIKNEIRNEKGLNTQRLNEYYERKERQVITPADTDMGSYRIIEKTEEKEPVIEEVLPPQTEKSVETTEESSPEIVVALKPIKRFLMWRSYQMEIVEGIKTKPLSWVLADKQKLPFMLKLDEHKGTIYGVIWGKGSFDLKIKITTQDQETKEVTIKLNVD